MFDNPSLQSAHRLIEGLEGAQIPRAAAQLRSSSAQPAQLSFSGPMNRLISTLSITALTSGSVIPSTTLAPGLAAVRDVAGWC